MRAYWLKSLNDERLESLEIEWFGSDEDTELLEIARDDLIGDYIGNDLKRDEKTLFEQNFLANNLDDVVLQKASVELSRKSEKTKKIGVFEKIFIGIQTFGRLPQIAAFAVLFLMCAGLSVIFWTNYNKSEEIARQQPLAEDLNKNFPKAAKTDQPQNSSTGEFSDTKNENGKNNSADKRNEKTTVFPNKNPNNDIAENVEEIKRNGSQKQQILLLTILRGNSKSRVISNSAEAVTLKLDMPGLEKTYDKYEIRIIDSGGNAVFKRAVKENLALKKSGEQITVSNIKSSNFRKNEKYKTVLVGIDKNGDEKDLGSYDNFVKN